MYLEGLCNKNDECPMVHNPLCEHYSTNNKSGQFVSRTDDAQAPADRGGQPQATPQGDATEKNQGRNKNNDLAKQEVFQRPGEPVISSSPEANATALALSSGPAAGANPSVSSGDPNGLVESRSMPKQTASRRTATRE